MSVAGSADESVDKMRRCQGLRKLCGVEVSGMYVQAVSVFRISAPRKAVKGHDLRCVARYLREAGMLSTAIVSTANATII